MSYFSWEKSSRLLHRRQLSRNERIRRHHQILVSPERAPFDSPGRSPGCQGRQFGQALKGRNASCLNRSSNSWSTSLSAQRSGGGLFGTRNETNSTPTSSASSTT